MKRRLGTKLIFLTLAALTLTACGSKKEAASAPKNEADMTPYGKYDETVTFTLGRPKYMGSDLLEGQTPDNNAATSFVKEQVNVVTKYAWEAQDNNQKNAMAIASGDIPDVMLVNREQFKQLIDGDMIADLTEVYDKVASPNMKKIFDSFGGRILPQVTSDGKIMGLPGTLIGGEHSLMWIRKDWLDKIGKPIPKTESEVFEVAKEFVEKDLGGEGKTVGLTAYNWLAGNYSSLYNMDPIFYLNHSYPRTWIEKDGKQAYGTVQPETKVVLEKLAKLYKEGTLDKQFAVRKSEDMTSLTASGKIGIIFGAWWLPYSDLQKSITNDPNAEWVPVAAPLDSDGKYNIPANDPVGSIVVVRKGYEHPEAVMKAINVGQDFKNQATPEAIEWMKKEAPGQQKSWDHQLVNVPILFDNNEVVKQIHDELVEAVETKDINKVRVEFQNTYKNYEKLQADGPKSDPLAWGDVESRFPGSEAAFDPANNIIDVKFFGQTESMSTTWANLKKLEDEMLVKIISGEEPVSYFDTFVKQWNEMGGEQVTKEVNEEVAKMK